MKNALRTDNLRAARPHCTCVEVRNYDYDRAAEKLGCHKRFLTDQIRQLPHQKIGESVAFCDCDLRVIQAMCTRIPDQLREDLTDRVPEPGETSPEPAVPPARRSLHEVRPAGSRRRKADATP